MFKFNIRGYKSKSYPYPEIKFYTQYKGIYYRFDDNCPLGPVWHLSDSLDLLGYYAYYNADIWRIDECFEIFLKEKEEDGLY